MFQYLNGAALGALTALTLTACQQDQPTSPSTNGSGTDGEEIIDFELTPAGAAAAKASVMVGTHGLPTIPLRGAGIVANQCQCRPGGQLTLRSQLQWRPDGEGRHPIRDLRELHRSGDPGDLLG